MKYGFDTALLTFTFRVEVGKDDFSNIPDTFFVPSLITERLSSGIASIRRTKTNNRFFIRVIIDCTRSTQLECFRSVKPVVF